MDAPRRRVDEIELVGGSPSLDFVNTVHDRYETPLRDYLTEYRELVRWGGYAGDLSAAEVRQLAALASAQSERARKTLRRAIDIREALYRVFTCVARQKTPPPRDLETLSRWINRALAQRRIAHHGRSCEWEWVSEPVSLDRVLWPVLAEAGELICSDQTARIRECPSCGWLFLDTSKNRSRRWCSMRTCGNIAKARRHYRRHRSGQQ